jgi:hypothetical protein
LIGQSQERRSRHKLLVTAGLDPAVHAELPLKKQSGRSATQRVFLPTINMDCRVKPGNDDEFVCGNQVVVAIAD